LISELNDEFLDEVMEIWLDVNISAHDFIDESYWKKSYDKVKTEYFPKAKTYILIKQDEIVGFISVMHEDYIGAIFIAEAYQGKGYGRELIEFVQWKFPYLKLHVYEKNNKAIRFYKNNGFEITQKEVDSMGNSELVMVWQKHKKQAI